MMNAMAPSSEQDMIMMNAMAPSSFTPFAPPRTSSAACGQAAGAPQAVHLPLKSVMAAMAALFCALTLPPPAAAQAISPSAVDADDRDIIIELYNKFHDPDWSNCNNCDPSRTPWEGSYWYGKSRLGVNAQGRVTIISLYSEHISSTTSLGGIPSSLGDLDQLTTLDLSGNEFIFSIPSSLGDLTNLTSLQLDGNDLSGSIPSSLGDLTNLTDLQLNQNDLSGSIPSSLGDLTNLTDLQLNQNDLSGSIPSSLGDLTNLTDLQLNQNDLSGSIPSSLGDLTNLTTLWLNHNDLSGEVPEELRNLTKLTSGNLSGNDDLCMPRSLKGTKIQTVAGTSVAWCEPSAPTLNSTTAGACSVTVAWTAPSDSGGSAITGYRIKYNDHTYKTITGPAATSSTVTGLTPGISYTFSVAAVNASGTGAYSGELSATPAVCTPSAPVPLTLTAGDEEIAAEWTLPADNGGAAIDGYTLQYRLSTSQTPTTVAIGTDTTSRTITGLTNGRQYSIGVAAVNPNGTGQWATGNATPRTTPGAPGGVTSDADCTTADEPRITLAWDAPADDGGAAITAYLLQYGSPLDADTSPVITHRDTDTRARAITASLAVNSTYTVTIAARNKAGPGDTATTTATTPETCTPATTPPALTGLTLTPGACQITARWDAPADDGGSAVTGYRIKYDGPAYKTVTDPAATSSTVTGLTPGTSYTFSVAAVNANGTGAYSAEGSATATPTACAASISLTLTPGDGSIEASWAAPTNCAGVFSYRLRYKTAAGSSWTEQAPAPTGSPRAITGLTNGTAYDVELTALETDDSDCATGSGTATPIATTPACTTRTGSSTTIDAGDKATLIDVYNDFKTPDWTGTTTGTDDWPWKGQKVRVGGTGGQRVVLDADGRVAVLRLDNNSLSGSIPAEFGDLTCLTFLRLDVNSLSGSIPAELGDLANLQTLYLSSNSLSGSIPAELGDLANLQTLYLFSNSLSGSIPAELGDLANLQTLYLFSNSLSGSIPAELGDLANLDLLSLNNNSLSGSIPAELGDLTNLTRLNLSGNSLSGSIPAELGDLANLRSLTLQSNSLSGAVPAELGDLANLTSGLLRYYDTGDNVGLCMPGSLAADKIHTVANSNGMVPWCGISLSVSPAAVAEDSGSTTVTVEAAWNGGTTAAAATAVTVGALAGTATEGADADYTTDIGGSGLTVTIPANTAKATTTFTLTVVDDTAVESPDETITLTGSYTHNSKQATTDTAVIAITDDDTAVCTTRTGSSSTIDAGDKAALVDVYDHFHATGWSGAAADWPWKGQTYNTTSGTHDRVQLDRDGRVTRLDLGFYSNGLSGSIPAELGGLACLRVLDLGSHSLSGSIPAELGGLTELTYLGLSGNSLSGSIPAELGDLPDLRSLFLSNNSLSGSIPAELGGLTNLYELYLSGNSLTGRIPAELGGLPELTWLFLNDNGLSGSIPAELGGLPELLILDLCGNSLTGRIPAELGDLTELGILELCENSLTGPVPEELGDLAYLIGGVLKTRDTGDNDGLCMPRSLAADKIHTVANSNGKVPWCGISLSVSPAAVAEDAGSVSVDVTATLTGAVYATAKNITVEIGAAGSTAADPADYTHNVTSAGLTVTIPANGTQGTAAFTLTVVDDAECEADETVVLEGTYAHNGNNNTKTGAAEIEIADDDTCIALTAAPSAVGEGAGATAIEVTAEASPAVASETAVVVTIPSDTAPASIFRTSHSQLTITIPDGGDEASGTFTLTPIDNDRVGNQHIANLALTGVAVTAAEVTLTLTGAYSNSGGAGSAGAAEVAISDDDGGIALTVTPSSVKEDAGAATVTVEAAAAAAVAADTTVTVDIPSDPNTPAAVYTASRSQLILDIPSGGDRASGTFTLTPISDTLPEGDETITLTGAYINSNTQGSTGAASITILDDDQPPGSPALAVAAGSCNTAQATITDPPGGYTVAGQNGYPARRYRLQYKKPADASWTTATTTSGTATLPAAAGSTARVYALTDTGSAANDIWIGPSTTQQAAPADCAIELTAAPSAVDENPATNPAAVTLKAALTGGVYTALAGGAYPDQATLTARIGGGTATQGADYQTAAAGHDITITAGQAHATTTIYITLTDDTECEGPETIGIAAANPSLPATANADITITDDDTACAAVSLSVDKDSIAEDAGPTTITITAKIESGTIAATGQDIAITVTPGTAHTPADYTATTPADITLAPGATTGATATTTLTITPADDSTPEGNQTLTITGAGANNTITITITDPNTTGAPAVSLSVDKDSIAEDAGPATITITAKIESGTIPSNHPAIAFTVTPGTAHTPADYTATTPADITLAPGATTGATATTTLTITPVDDSTPEGNQTLTITGAGANNTITITITDPTATQPPPPPGCTAPPPDNVPIDCLQGTVIRDIAS